MSSKVFMTMSIFIRMAVGLGVFALLARGLGPKEFGFVSLVFSYASLGSLLTDFGLAMKTLRDIAHQPEQGRALLVSTLKIKAVFSLVITAGGLIVVLMLPISREAKLASCFLTGGVMIASFGDLALVAFRATNRFGRESWIVGWTSLVYGCVLGAIIYLGGGIVAISIGFLFCRVLYAGIALVQALKLFPTSILQVPAHSLLATAKSALSWALLSNLSYVNGQIDSVVIAPLLGLHGTGIYQSGAKFASSAVTFASVVTNTQVPRIAAAAANGSSTLRLERVAWAQMTGAGACSGLVIALGGPLITRYLIGSQYGEVNQLWIGFGCLTFLRFFSSSMLVSLVALNRAKTNLVGEAATTVVSIPLLILLVPHYGLASVPWVMCAGAIATASVLILGRLGIRGERPDNFRPRGGVSGREGTLVEQP